MGPVRGVTCMVLIHVFELIPGIESTFEKCFTDNIWQIQEFSLTFKYKFSQPNPQNNCKAKVTLNLDLQEFLVG